jgi:hypothetical protein
MPGTEARRVDVPVSCEPIGLRDSAVVTGWPACNRRGATARSGLAEHVGSAAATRVVGRVPSTTAAATKPGCAAGGEPGLDVADAAVPLRHEIALSCTLGSASTAAVSTPVIRACACGLRPDSAEKAA